MLICNETPMELYMTPTWIPDEFILINSIMAYTMGICSDCSLKILLTFLLILHMLGESLAEVNRTGLSHLPDLPGSLQC